MDRNARLVNQESFLNYCFKRNDEDVRYWEKWLADNPDQRHEIEQLKQLVILMSEESRERIRKSNYSELQTRIGQSGNVPENKLLFLRKRWWAAAAAAIFILLGSTIFLYMYKQNVKETAVVYANDVLPGQNKAVLVLSDGQSVNLTDEQEGIVASQVGVKISKTSSGEIIYSGTGDAGSGNNHPVYNTVKVPAGGQFQISLSDGTKVWLNSASAIKYPVEFSGKERLVELTGEAYFEVAHNKNKPFRVKSGGQVINVLGTHFNVSAYDDEKFVRTTLVEGSVEIVANKEKVKIKPGEMAEFGENGIKVSNVDVEDMIAWKNGYFKFNDDLESVMHKISRWYDVDIVYENAKETEHIPIYFGGEISRTKKLSTVLKIMETTKRVRFKIEGRTVTVIR